MKHLLLALCSLLLLQPVATHAQCNPDLTPPVAVCVGELSLDVSPNGQSITVQALDLNANSYDACTPSNQLQYFIEAGAPSATPPATTSLQFTNAQAGDINLVLWAVDEAGNAANCQTLLHLSVCQPAFSLACNDHVVVELGADGTYTLTSGDILVGGPYCDYNWYGVRVDNMPTWETTVTLTPGDIGLHQVSVSGTGAICWGVLEVHPGELNENCPQLLADITTPAIRPCFDGTYAVFYGNGSALQVGDTYVEVTLDDALEFISSTLPSTQLDDHRYRFNTGDLSAGQTGIFYIDYHTDCNALVGETHCSEASIFPNVSCNSSGAWNGAEIRVTGNCVNDSIHLQIHNVGQSAMAQPLDYVVVEDVLMLQSGSFNLGPQQSLSLPPIAGAGPTYRLEAQQEPGYPFGGAPAVAIEGCGGLHPGLVTLFPTENSNPAVAIHCRESTLSHDPNDKQALPVGLGDEHFIDAKTDLNYMIRFQNTGTDTAFKVVLVDTLSSRLDPQTVRVGAASHPYEFRLSHDGVIRVTFNNILLPHQAVNDAGSNGYVQFSVKQKPGNPDGTRIENTASIYFDYNAPIRTNTTFHTVGSHFIGAVATEEPAEGLPQIEVYPNPATDRMYFDSPVATGPLNFQLIDGLGRVALQRDGQQLPMTLERGGMTPGMYLFRFSDGAGRRMWSGKVIIR